MSSHKKYCFLFVILPTLFYQYLCVEISPELPLEKSITFTIIKSDGERVVSTFEQNDIMNKGCNKSEKFAIIVHGWLESIDIHWLQDTLSNFTKYRGGCIMVMDYYNHSKGDYFSLVSKFYKISDVLVKKLHQFKQEGFDYDQGYMFGFSFGGRLVTHAGMQLTEKIAAIDTCDSAGPGFDGSGRVKNSFLAAKNVQCIHTSTDKGTSVYDCDQDWLMGHCGRRQPAYINKMYHRHHALCVKFFNNAFHHDFYAEDNFSACPVTKGLAKFPEKFKMGYMENRKDQVRGILFARTSKHHPFN